MTITRIGATTDPLRFRARCGNATTGISSATITVPEPGTVHLLTSGDEHVVLEHVSYYVDVQARYDAAGELSLTRTHIVYRYGPNAPLSDGHRDAVLALIVDWLAELWQVGGAEIGTAGEDPATAQARTSLAEIRRALEAAKRERDGALTRQRRAGEQVSAAEARIAALDAQMRQRRQVMVDAGVPAEVVASLSVTDTTVAPEVPVSAEVKLGRIAATLDDLRTPSVVALEQVRDILRARP